jgi:hypothetical protein
VGSVFSGIHGRAKAVPRDNGQVSFDLTSGVSLPDPIILGWRAESMFAEARHFPIFWFDMSSSAHIHVIAPAPCSWTGVGVWQLLHIRRSSGVNPMPFAYSCVVIAVLSSRRTRSGDKSI